MKIVLAIIATLTTMFFSIVLLPLALITVFSLFLDDDE